jgi:hypothetical protein
VEARVVELQTKRIRRIPSSCSAKMTSRRARHPVPHCSARMTSRVIVIISARRMKSAATRDGGAYEQQIFLPEYLHIAKETK